MISKSQAKRLLIQEADQPMRLMFREWISTYKGNRPADVTTFSAGFNAAMEHRKLLSPSADVFIKLFDEWVKGSHSENYHRDIETIYASGWEAGKRFR